jgi:hypothetical protein
LGLDVRRGINGQLIGTPSILFASDDHDNLFPDASPALRIEQRLGFG